MDELKLCNKSEFLIANGQVSSEPPPLLLPLLLDPHIRGPHTQAQKKTGKKMHSWAALIVKSPAGRPMHTEGKPTRKWRSRGRVSFA